MNPKIQPEVDDLRQAIRALENQRSLLGEAVAETALAPLKARLAELETLLQLGQGALAPEAAPAAALALEIAGEQRKLVTVLFADLVGFTALSEGMDPEDVHLITNAYFQRWTAAIEALGGSVEKFIGDAVMAVFGLHQAGEQDPENAIRAALEMRAQLKELNQEYLSNGLLSAASFSTKLQEPLRMRVGIHTGLVVASLLPERKGMDFVVVGDTVNLASRLQGVAPVNGILISHDTYRHVRGVFDMQVVEPVSVKGKKDPIQVYVVLQAKPRAFRQERHHFEGLEISMVGREAELSTLQELFQQVITIPARRMATIIGDAGVGKTRLLYEFDDWLELEADYYFFKGRANSKIQSGDNKAEGEAASLPFALLRDLFAYRFGILDSDSPDIVREKLEQGVLEAFLEKAGSDEENTFSKSLTEAASLVGASAGQEGSSRRLAVRKGHFIGRAVGFALGDSEYLRAVEPRQVREQGLVYMADYFRALAARQAVVILLEDLHWADNSALEVLLRLNEALEGLPVLVVCTARPALLEQRPDWGSNLAYHRRISLAPLTAQATNQLVAEFLQKVPNLSAELQSLIVQNAEGNPFYVEELIKMLVEEGVIHTGEGSWEVTGERLASLRIPPTLVEVLQARLDSLNPMEKVLLQRAAVIGRTFWDEALAFIAAQHQAMSASSSAEGAERSFLEALTQRELIYGHPESTFDHTREFTFKHALLRDVSYESLLKSYRRVYHGHAARWLELVTERSQRADEYAGLIAEHHLLAGEIHPAADWYWRAARMAKSQYANREALYFYSRALELIDESELVKRCGLLLEQVKIYDLLAEYQNLESLLGELDHLVVQVADEEKADVIRVEIYLQRANLAMKTGDYHQTIAYASQAAEIAQGLGLAELESRSHSLWASAHRYMSDYPAAQEHYEKIILLAEQTGQEIPHASALLGLGVISEIQADYASARHHLEQALAIYRETNDLLGESRALNSLGVVLTNQGDLGNALRYLEQALQLKILVGERFGEGVVLCNLGVAAEKRHDLDLAIAYFERTRQVCESIDDAEGLEAALIGIANNQTSLGDYATALVNLEQALVISREIEDRQGEADILTSLGMISLEHGAYQEARLLCQQGLAITLEIGAPREQGYARFYLGCILEQMGKIEEAEQEYQVCLELRRKDQAGQWVDPLCGMARGKLARGDLENATSFALRAFSIVEECRGEGLVDPALAYLTCYQVLRFAQPLLAQRALQDGRDFLLRIAARIQNEPLRRSFLENVRANRQLLAQP